MKNRVVRSSSSFCVGLEPTTCGLTVRLTVAVPGVRLGGGAPALHTDRCHSLPSLESATGGGRVAPYLLRYAQSVK